tara:strand:- start:3364 stop:4545 length:1182 start_codon:yes stop_codon:yes gene_type:complete
MALIQADRVKETSSTTGTGNFTLGGAATGFRTFADGVGVSNTCYYVITDDNSYEVGLGTLNASATLVRTTVITSSNSNAAVDWGAGAKDVFTTYPGPKAVILDDSNNLNVAGNVSIGGTFLVTGEFNLSDVSASGTLDVASNASVGGTLKVDDDITNTSGNLTVDPTTKIFEIKGGGSTDGTVKLNCRTNLHGQKIMSQPHSEGVTNEMLLPKGANSTLVSEVGTASLTNKTFGDGVSVNGTLNIGNNTSVTQTFAVTGTTFLNEISEGVNIVASTAGSTVDLNFLDGGILFHTGTASTNFVFNIRGDGSTSLNSVLSVGDAAGVALIMPQDATPRQQTSLKIDGVTASGLHWQGGATAEATGNGIEVFAVNIIKTGDADYTVFESITNFLKN